MSGDYLFVDEDLRVYTGDAARARVQENNDLQYLDGGLGILKVPKTRWSVAQHYERNTWLAAGAHATDDRNEEHAAAFDLYQTIAGKTFPRAIELGCGPFTNLRILGRHTRIDRCVLLDPLIESYLQHRHCTYQHGLVKLSASALHDRLDGRLAARALRRLIRAAYPRLLEIGIPVERRIALPIEEMPDCGTFDLIVMINVLEHCYDIDKIFVNLLHLTRPGTVFVFHDRIFAPDEVRQDAARRFDAGHPLRIAGAVLTGFLRRNFTTLAERWTDVADQTHGIDLTERGIYYIGVRP